MMVPKIMAMIMVLLWTTSYGHLPPGHEDEIYCPSSHCLQRRIRKSGYCGSVTSFWYCCNANIKISPQVWGNKLDTGIKDKLLNDGWTRAEKRLCQTPQCSTSSNETISKVVRTGRQAIPNGPDGEGTNRDPFTGLFIAHSGSPIHPPHF